MPAENESLAKEGLTGKSGISSKYRCVRTRINL